MGKGREREGRVLQKSPLVPPTWCDRTYFQVIEAKKGSEGEGGFGGGRVVLPHGDYFRASEVGLHLHLHLLHQEEQKVFASLFIVSASNASWLCPIFES